MTRRLAWPGLLWSCASLAVSTLFMFVLCFQDDAVLCDFARDCTERECVSVPLQGVGFFSAGFLAKGRNISGALQGRENRVLWTDLNTANACVKGSEVFRLYSRPLGLCPEDARGNLQFELTPVIKALQLHAYLSLICGMIAIISILVFFLVKTPISKQFVKTAVGMTIAALFSVTFCVVSWFQWSGTKLYTTEEGFYLPLWREDGETIIVERFKLKLNNPKFQSLVACIPCFAIGFVCSSASICYQQRQELRSDTRPLLLDAE